MEIWKKARQIILEDLRSCYRSEGILASNVNFSDFWARDSFWASLGLIEADFDFDQVKKSLELFLCYQREDGKIPRKIILDYNGFKYVGVKIKRKTARPIYTSSLKWHFSVDDNLLFVLAFCRYVEKTKNIIFASKYYEQIEKSLKFYLHQELIRNSLIYEVGFSNWMDTIYKKGFVLYTNSLWYETIKEWEKLQKMLGKNKLKGIPASQDIYSQIQKISWLDKEGYFADSVNLEGKQKKYFALAGNVLAILFEVATQKQAEKILDKAESIHQEWGGTLHSLNYPLYPFWKVSPVLYLLNIQKYQNGISWSWIEDLLIAAEIKVGRMDSARRHLENLSNIIIKNGHLHETYWLDGRPFDHKLWKSAVPFAWGAGLFLYTLSKLEKK